MNYIFGRSQKPVESPEVVALREENARLKAELAKVNAIIKPEIIAVGSLGDNGLKYRSAQYVVISDRPIQKTFHAALDKAGLNPAVQAHSHPVVIWAPKEEPLYMELRRADIDRLEHDKCKMILVFKNGLRWNTEQHVNRLASQKANIKYFDKGNEQGLEEFYKDLAVTIANLK